MVHSFSLVGHAPLFSHNAITHMNIQHDSQSASLIYPCEKASLHVHSGGAGVVRSDARAPPRSADCPLGDMDIGYREYRRKCDIENVLVYGARGHIARVIYIGEPY